MTDKPFRDLDHFDQWAATYEQSFLQRLLFRPVHAAMLEALIKNGSDQTPRDISISAAAPDDCFETFRGCGRTPTYGESTPQGRCSKLLND